MAGAGKTIAVAGIATILVVAAVVGVVVGVTRGGAKKGNGGKQKGPAISGSTKAVQAICSSTDYKDTCQASLSHANTTEPKGLIDAALKFLAKNIADVLQNSTLIQEAAKEPGTKEALDICKEVLETAREDAERSAGKFNEFDIAKVDDYVEDVKTWLSAVVTYQETCIDAFENTTGDTREKMVKLLNMTRQLSSNGLAMMSDITSIISGLGLNIKYAGDPTDYAPGEDPAFRRRLLGAGAQMKYGGDPTDYAPGEDPHWSRRLLSHAKHAKHAQSSTVVVAQDGSGHYKTISEAINAVPKKNTAPFYIHVKAGIYRENVQIPKHRNYIVLYGDGPSKTIVTGDKNYAKGVKTFHTATFAVNGEDFVAKDITFENTAGPEGHQAVALRVSADKAVFYNVHLYGYQDTLYCHAYRQYYRDCTISGTIDFIFGDSRAVFQNCNFIVRKPMANQACMVTAQGRTDPRSAGAIVIHGGSITAEKAFTDHVPQLKAYLGRPWKELSRTIIMQADIGGFIAPEGWSPWSGNFALDTLYYAEYANRGAGANLQHRVKWKGIQHMTPAVADSWTPGKVFIGDQQWLTAAGVPFVPTMLKI